MMRIGGPMKHGVKPTTAQRKLLQKRRLDPAVWLVVKDLPDRLELVHRLSDRTVKTVPKGERK